MEDELIDSVKVSGELVQKVTDALGDHGADKEYEGDLDKTLEERLLAKPKIIEERKEWLKTVNNAKVDADNIRAKQEIENVAEAL